MMHDRLRQLDEEEQIPKSKKERLMMLTGSTEYSPIHRGGLLGRREKVSKFKDKRKRKGGHKKSRRH